MTNERRIGHDAAVRNPKQGGICRECVHLSRVKCNGNIELAKYIDGAAFSCDLHFSIVSCDQFEKEGLSIEDLTK